MAKNNPTFDLKTGADSDLAISREEMEKGNVNKGKIKRTDGIYRFPYLARRTGDTLAGTTENIESNELKHGRTKSAPRKGSSSSSGDINFEFSAETFDDLLEAALRGKWTRWVSDTESVSNKDGKTFTNGYFDTKCAEGTGGKKLIYDGTGTGDGEGLVEVANNGAGFVIHELNCGSDAIEYSLLRKYGGPEGEDLWQEFSHCAINTFNLSVEIDSIITGSFGIMGTNNPKLDNDSEIHFDMEGRISGGSDTTNLKNKGNWAATTAYALDDVVYTDGKSYKCTTAHTSGSSFDVTEAANWTALTVTNDFINDIPSKATETMQMTAREGFLYINGQKIEFAQSLSLSLDNGMTQKKAIFVPTAISSTPLELNITGDLSTYLIGDKNYAKELFNNAVDDGTVELLFCLQDKQENPDAVYLFQIFNAKHTENTINGNGADTYDESLPWQSFGEKALRVFRIILPHFSGMTIYNSDIQNVQLDRVAINPTVAIAAEDVGLYNASTNPNGVKLSMKVDDAEVSTPGFSLVKVDDSGDTDGCAIYSFTAVEQGAADKKVEIIAEWNGQTVTQTAIIPAS